jgi:hypothetical protein
MAPSTLQGLNVVQPRTESTNQLSDADLLTVPNYPPELAAQLDLWTNLAFQSDEPSSSFRYGLDSSPTLGSASGITNADGSRKRSYTQRDEEDEDDEAPAGPAIPDGHENVVNPTSTTVQTHAAAISAGAQADLDLHTFLASLGLPMNVTLPSEPGSTGPSLGAILSMYQNQGSPDATTPSTTAPARALAPISTGAPASSSSSASRTTKKARKASNATSSSASAVTPFPPATPISPTSPLDAFDDEDQDNDELLAGLTPAEDKRRRNTAASARFRAKKKEREQALERKAKDLDGRVADLERECEALRRENGWLRGLVVGATGAAGAPLIPGLALPPPKA